MIKLQLYCSARPHSRARIETNVPNSKGIIFVVAPGLTAGRGLKHDDDKPVLAKHFVAPGLTAGRGLKQTELKIKQHWQW